MTINLTDILEYISIAVTLASVLLLAINWLEPLLLIWMPREGWPRFWGFYKKLTATIEYVSLSRHKLGRSDAYPLTPKDKP